MGKTTLRVLSVLSLICFLTTSLSAQDLLLEEEMLTENNDLVWVNQKTFVVTATKKKEKLEAAPANITVLTAKQIETMGVSSLSEVLALVPGITVMENYYGYTNITFRGNFQEIYNNNSLLLINGHPSWEVINGSYHLEQISLDAIKQVEIIRGPGSVLYGTNAYAGVINVITKTGKTQKGVKATLKGGSFDHMEARFTYGTGSDLDKWDILVSGSYVDSDGYEFNVNPDEMRQSGSVDYETDFSNIQALFNYKNLSINLGAFESTRTILGVAPILLLSGENEFQGTYSDIGYKHQLSDNLSLEAHLRYDTIEKDLWIRTFTGGLNIIQDGTKTGVEVQTLYKVSDQTSFIFGGSFDEYEMDPYKFENVDPGAPTSFTSQAGVLNTEEAALYLQGEHSFSDTFKMVGGARFTDNEKAGENVSPSVGLVWQFAEGKYWKFLYGSAFRSPNLYEQYVQFRGIIDGNQDLEAESIDTFDMGVDITLNQKVNLKLNAFYLETEDRIQRADTDLDGTPNYTNGTGDEIYGLEGDIKADFSKQLSGWINFAYTDGENSETGDDIAYLAELTSNLGLSYRPTEKLGLHTQVQYVGDREGSMSSQEVDAYAVVNLMLQYSILKDMKISLIGKNVFDEEYSYPEYIRQNLVEIGNGPEAAYYVQLDCRF